MTSRKGERINVLNEKYDILEEQPHITLFQTSPPPSEMLPTGNDYHKNQNWYVAFTWTEQHRGEEIGCHLTLSNWLFYPQAFSEAIRQAKNLNVPALKQGGTGYAILWTPTEESTPEQKEAVRKLQE
ncbi:hypothetical protein MYX06_04895 [Patescibacteria group bacterium AH-259-L05]|nr:hypothetical protein [Patescibacteria group bacterium AH-259-L05]